MLTKMLCLQKGDQATGDFIVAVRTLTHIPNTTAYYIAYACGEQRCLLMRRVSILFICFGVVCLKSQRVFKPMLHCCFVCATLRTQKATQTNFRIGHTLWCSYHSVFDRRGNITGVWCWRIVGFAIVDVISRHLIRRRYISRLVESLCTVFSYKET